MKLADEADVLSKLGTGSHADSLALASTGLEYATAQIENVLNTQLAENTRLDVFDFFPGRYYDPYKFTKLQLLATQGFWDAEGDIAVYLSTDGTKLTPENIEAATPLSTEYYSVNYEQGTVTVTAAPLEGIGTIAAVYTAGYADQAANIPDWLSQAAVGYAVQNIQAHNIGYNKKGMVDKNVAHTRVAYASLSNKIRTRLGISPSQTVVL